MLRMLEMGLPSMSDRELDSLIAEAEAEKARRANGGRESKHSAARSAKRDLRCPECKTVLWKDGKRKKDGVQAYVCPKCRRKSCDTAGTSLHASKIPLHKVRLIVALVMLDLPAWIISVFAGVSDETAGFWRDRCLDAAQSWSRESRLSGHVWIDEMQFAPPQVERPGRRV